MDIAELTEEVFGYVADVKTMEEGETITSNYRKVIAYIVRLQEIHNEIVLLEISNIASPEIKKFRTMIIDETLPQLKLVANFESRKISALQLEANLTLNRNA